MTRKRTDIILDSYKLITNKVKLDGKKRFFILSDLHLGKRSLLASNRKKLKKIIDFLSNQGKIEAFLVVGDLVNNAKSFKNSEHMEQLKLFLSSLGNLAPTIVSKGNHDLFLNSDESSKAFRDLSKLKNVFPLDNEQIIINGINYTGFSQRVAAYRRKNYGPKANKMFVEDFKSSNFSFDPKSLNILLNHSPIEISSNESLKELGDMFEAITFIASGHQHNGCVPNYLERTFQHVISDKGLWENPKTLFATDMCRGAYLLGKEEKSEVYLPKENGIRVIESLGRNSKKKSLLAVSKGITKFYWYGNGIPSVTEVVIINKGQSDKRIY